MAGVGDVRALTTFESRAIDQLSLPAASDSLVDAVIVAAYHGLSVVAWCVPLASVSTRANGAAPRSLSERR